MVIGQKGVVIGQKRRLVIGERRRVLIGQRWSVVIGLRRVIIALGSKSQKYSTDW